MSNEILQDLKDKDGRKIFQGDVILHNGKRFLLMKSKNIGWCFVEINKNIGSYAEDLLVMTNHNRRTIPEIKNYIKYTEVIGNIYMNPELLNVTPS